MCCCFWETTPRKHIGVFAIVRSLSVGERRHRDTCSAHTHDGLYKKKQTFIQARRLRTPNDELNLVFLPHPVLEINSRKCIPLKWEKFCCFYFSNPESVHKTPSRHSTCCLCAFFRRTQPMPSGETIKAISCENLTFLFLWGNSRWTRVCMFVHVCVHILFFSFF